MILAKMSRFQVKTFDTDKKKHQFSKKSQFLTKPDNFTVFRTMA